MDQLWCVYYYEGPGVPAFRSIDQVLHDGDDPADVARTLLAELPRADRLVMIHPVTRAYVFARWRYGEVDDGDAGTIVTETVS